MNLKKIVGGLALAGLTAGMVGTAAPASATVSSASLYLELGGGPVVGVGSTNPGQVGNKACVMVAADAGGARLLALGTPNYSGAFNGTPGVNAASVIDEVFSEATIPGVVTGVPTVATCTPLTISADNVGTTVVVDSVKHKGTFTAVQTNSTVSGVSASSNYILEVAYSAGQTVIAPTGSTVLSGALSGSSPVRLQLATAITKNKSSLNLAQCSDVDVLVDLAPSAVDAKGYHTASGLTATNTLANAGVENFATIHECSQNATPVASKPGKAVFKVSGAAGPVSVDFVQANILTGTLRTWDTTRGACKLTDNVNRVLTCKGDYGTAVPVAIVIRPVDSAFSATDPLGLQHIAPPAPIMTGTL